MVLSGRFSLAVLVGIIPVLLRPQWSTVLIWLLVLGLVAAVDLALASSPRTLDVVREDVDQVRLGESTSSALVVGNPGRRRARVLLRDAWQPSAGALDNRHRLDLPPGERRRAVTTLTPTRRGDRRADRVTVRTSGPLGLVARQASIEIPGTVRSLPAFTSRRHLPSRLARLRELDGRAAVRVRGQGTEFDSLRDYVSGDDVRSIDWRASARRRNVVVRTWQPERERRVVLVLDTSRTSAARVHDMPRLDASMDAALLLAALAERAGDKVSLVAGDRQVRARFRAGGRGAVPGLVQVLADLEPMLVEADWDVLAGGVAGLSRQRALVVLLTAMDPAAIEEGLLPVLPTLAHRHRVVLATVRDPALAELGEDRSGLAQVYDAAAAEQVLQRHAHTTAVLARLGVTVVDAEPDQLPVALTDHYLLLKARGLL